MDYENFKEQIVEEVKSGLYEKGFEVNVTTQHVDKLNDGYDAMTITPADSNIGMNINISQLYEQMENGRDFAEVSHMAVETAATHLEDMPVVDVAQLTDYEQMKGKLAIEVVSLEANADMLSKIPHGNLTGMTGTAPKYRKLRRICETPCWIHTPTFWKIRLPEMTAI